MAQSKKMNAAGFAKLVKELDSVGELILTKQDEKQSVMDDFEKEKVRYKKGKISEDTLASSAKKVNAEFARLDKGIREAILKVGKLSANTREFAKKQAPKIFRANVSGFKLLNGPKKTVAKKVARKPAARKPAARKPAAKKAIPSKTTLAKEKVLDRKYSKK
jgi:hypothetical protein